MLVYRIVHKKYANSLFASGLEGRWNKQGQKVLYTAENVALAYLELMYYRKGVGFNDDFKIMLIQLPDNKFSTEIDASKLNADWRNFRNYSSCQKMSFVWFEKTESLTLRVPSAIVPQNFNVVINTEHPDYAKVKLIEVLDFCPDERLENLLKKYN